MEVTMSRKSIITRWIICLLPLFLYLVPTTESFTPEIRSFFAITLVLVLCLCLGQVQMMIVTFAIPMVYWMTGLLTMESALSAYAGGIIWIGVSCFILVNVLSRIGLMKRIAFWIIYRTGGSYRGFCFGMLLVGCILCIVAPAPQIGTVLFFLCAAICKEMDMKVGRTTAGIMFASAVACNTTQLFLYMPTQQGISLGIAGVEMSWINYLIQNLPFIVIVLVVTFLIPVILPQDEAFNGKEYAKMKLDEMGKVTTEEKLTAVVLVLFVAFLLTTTYTGLNIVYGFVLVPIVLFLIGVGKGEDIVKVNFGVLMMIGGCMAIGSAAAACGAGAWLANLLLPLFGGMSEYGFISFSYIFGVIMNFLMTPMAAMSSLSQPLAEIAATVGVGAKESMLAFCAGLEQWVFPYEVGYLVTLFGLGYMKMKDFMKFGLIKMIIVSIGMFALVIPYWMLIS